jgi:hypothetical protein
MDTKIKMTVDPTSQSLSRTVNEYPSLMRYHHCEMKADGFWSGSNLTEDAIY